MTLTDGRTENISSKTAKRGTNMPDGEDLDSSLRHRDISTPSSANTHRSFKEVVLKFSDQRG